MRVEIFQRSPRCGARCACLGLICAYAIACSSPHDGGGTDGSGPNRLDFRAEAPDVRGPDGGPSLDIRGPDGGPSLDIRGPDGGPSLDTGQGADAGNADCLGPPVQTCSSNEITRTEDLAHGGGCVKRVVRAVCPFGCAATKCADPPAGTDGVMNILQRWWIPGVQDHFTQGTATTYAPPYVWEGRSYYVPSSAGAGRITLYRHFNATLTDHMTSTSSSEGSGAGYLLEGPLGFPFAAQHVGTAALKRWYNSGTTDHMLARAGEAPAGYTVGPSQGYGYPRHGAAREDLVPVAGGGITMKVNRVAGGTVWELWWKGKQFINDWDFGRQVQVDLFLDNQGNNNPTEGGSKRAHPLSEGDVIHLRGSPLLHLKATGASITTATRPLQFKPELNGGGPDNPVIWSGFFGKTVELGFAGMPNVIRWTTLFHLVKAEPTVDAQVVVAFLNQEFKRFWAYDTKSKKLTEMTAAVETASKVVPPGYILNAGCIDPSEDPTQLQPASGGVIISTADESYAMGIYRRHGQKNFALCNWRFEGDPGGQYGNDTAAMALNERHPSAGLQAGSHLWTAYLVLGTLNDCVNEMDALRSSGY